MKNKLLITLLVILVLCFGSFVARSRSVPQPVIYEYKMVALPSEKKLNELGTEGWELCAIDAKGGVMGSPTVGTYVFKRAK